jgi:hypothetical protein
LRSAASRALTWITAEAVLSRCPKKIPLGLPLHRLYVTEKKKQVSVRLDPLDLVEADYSAKK